MFTEVSASLTRNYIKAGLTTEEYVVLNAYLNHSKLLENSYDFQEVGEMIGKSKNEVTRILTVLFEKKFIQVKQDSSIDIVALKAKLKVIEQESMLLSDQIAESMELYNQLGGYTSQFQHSGQVTLVPFSDGGIAVTKGTDSIYGHWMWSHKNMKKLVEELSIFLENTDQEWINSYNEELKAEIKAKKEKQKILDEERQKKKEHAATPKSGYVILIRLYPSGNYKFTYTCSDDLNGKHNRLKEEYGHNVEIIHSVETYDTLKFFYQFAKKQFSNRMVEKSIYNLTEEDVQFFKGEKYPANAMDWLEGSK
ncbi:MULTISPECIES: hypothetical protein [Bacillus cereus group]|uniref:hypothetical protein n=1 Tax=Bacillus cereus group TaxID=86661 RepID=UPI000B4B7B8A|nr:MULTISPECIES: hypothetical protein [Bacillus cereus group]MBY5229319.1 NADH dehydrogenase [Bacillus paranthracis]MCY9249091.1 hypothetical protein [Bacillus paranthracis]MDR4159450.1 hypothetical protein [Bacillus paranthracis]MDR4416441.1 hypothetical protein [Bacillus paranthracis]MED1515749.1 hypothetical protein [Bacillus paranthracis]